MAATKKSAEPGQPESDQPVVYQWTVRVKAKPTAHGQYDDAVLSDPLQVSEVSKAEAARRSKDMCMTIKPGRYYRARFAHHGVRVVHESWIQWPKPPKVPRRSALQKAAEQVATVVPRHRKAEVKAREQAAKQVLPAGAPEPKTRRSKWKRLRSGE